VAVHNLQVTDAVSNCSFQKQQERINSKAGEQEDVSGTRGGICNAGEGEAAEHCGARIQIPNLDPFSHLVLRKPAGARGSETKVLHGILEP